MSKTFTASAVVICWWLLIKIQKDLAQCVHKALAAPWAIQTSETFWSWLSRASLAQRQGWVGDDRNQEVPYFTISVLSIFLIVNRLLRKSSISILLSKQTCKIGGFFLMGMCLSLWVRSFSLLGSHVELTSLYTRILIDVAGTNATMQSFEEHSTRLNVGHKAQGLFSTLAH